MVATLQREVFDAMLPGTPCKSETRKRIEEIAEERHISKAQVIRFAVEKFLADELKKIQLAAGVEENHRDATQD